MELESRVMALPDFIDRRNDGYKNRLRRFLNNYWLIPLFIIYLQLYSVVFATGNPVNAIVEANKNFVNGASMISKLVVSDFPYTIKGHFKEAAYILSYKAGRIGVSNKKIESIIENDKLDIYSMIIKSQAITFSEVGGMVFLKDDTLSLIPIPSKNGELSETLHRTTDNNLFATLLASQGAINIIEKVDIDRKIVADTQARLSNPLVPTKVKDDIRNRFVTLYDRMSEYNYLLMPLEFKRIIGRKSGYGQYVGFYHIHNGYYEEPSSIDVQRSHEERQIIFTLTDKGFRLYDIIKGEESATNINL